MRKREEARQNDVSQDETRKSGLSKKRIIAIYGTVDGKCEKRIILALKALNKESCYKKILLFINSTGGEADSGSHIAEAIRASKAPVYGIVIWSACSAAFDVLQACKKRIACSNKSIIMCHGVTLDDIRVDQVDRDKMIKKTEEEHAHCLRLVVARSCGKITFEELRELSRKEENISACRARRLGLLDRVMYKKKKKGKK